MAEQGQCIRKIQNCHFLVTDETFSLCSLLLFSWNCVHDKGLFPLMRRHPGYTGICLTLQITKLKMRFPTQPDKISDGQRACAGKCIYLKQILPAASGKTTTYEYLHLLKAPSKLAVMNVSIEHSCTGFPSMPFHQGSNKLRNTSTERQIFK